jgi:hypothetical protein
MTGDMQTQVRDVIAHLERGLATALAMPHGGARDGKLAGTIDVAVLRLHFALDSDARRRARETPEHCAAHACDSRCEECPGSGRDAA